MFIINYSFFNNPLLPPRLFLYQIETSMDIQVEDLTEEVNDNTSRKSNRKRRSTTTSYPTSSELAYCNEMNIILGNLSTQYGHLDPSETIFISNLGNQKL